MYIADTFSEGTWCAGIQTGSHKGCLPFEKMADNLPGVSSHFNHLGIKKSRHDISLEYMKTAKSIFRANIVHMPK